MTRDEYDKWMRACLWWLRVLLVGGWICWLVVMARVLS